MIKMPKTSGNPDSEKVLTLLKEIESNPHLTQRHLSQKFSISLGKINFLIRALVDKGLIEIKNFKESKNKLGYVYMLTPKGIQIKLHLTQQFLEWKIKEYERLREEIEKLRKEVLVMPKENFKETPEIKAEA
jgi:EPS-associated MarR family transcriptional regulator